VELIDDKAEYYKVTTVCECVGLDEIISPYEKRIKFVINFEIDMCLTDLEMRGAVPYQTYHNPIHTNTSRCNRCLPLLYLGLLLGYILNAKSYTKYT